MPAGCYQDPTGKGQARSWNGTSWTQTVYENGSNTIVPIDPAQTQQPPLPGTQMQLRTIAAAQPTTVIQQRFGVSAASIVFGVIAVVLIIVIIAIVNNSDSDDAPTPGTDGPAVTLPDNSGTDAPADDG